MKCQCCGNNLSLPKRNPTRRSNPPRMRITRCTDGGINVYLAEKELDHLGSGKRLVIGIWSGTGEIVVTSEEGTSARGSTVFHQQRGLGKFHKRVDDEMIQLMFGSNGSKEFVPQSVRLFEHGSKKYVAFVRQTEPPQKVCGEDTLEVPSQTSDAAYFEVPRLEPVIRELLAETSDAEESFDQVSFEDAR